MKQVFALLILALALVVAFAVFTGMPGPVGEQQPNVSTGSYQGTIGVVVPDTADESVTAVKQGMDIAYQTLDSKLRPHIVYLNATDVRSASDGELPEMVAVVTVTDDVSRMWDAVHPSFSAVRVSVAAPGYAATAPDGVISLSTPPFYEVSSLRSLLGEHDVIAVFGPDTAYTRQYIEALGSVTSSRIISDVYSETAGWGVQLRSLLSQNPKLLVLTGGTGVPDIVAKAREFGLTGPVLLSSWTLENPSVVADPRMEGGYAALRVSSTDTHPFYEIYATKYSTNASLYAAEGYDAIVTLARLIPASEGNPAYISGWYMGKSYEGAAGSYVFDSEGTGRVLMQVGQFRSGSIVPVDRYVRPPSEIIIGVYGNAEVVRGAAAAAELINGAYSLNLPGASTSGISGLYGAKVVVRSLSYGTPVPDNVSAVVGDLRGVRMNLPAVHTAAGEVSSGSWLVSLSPDQIAGFSSFLDLVTERRSYDASLQNVTILYPESVRPPAEMVRVLEEKSYAVEQVSYSLPLSESEAVAVFSDLNCSGQILISIPDSAHDLSLFLSASQTCGQIPAFWYVFGDVILGDPKVVQSTLVYDSLISADVWSQELGKSNPLIKEVSLFYSKVLPGSSMTGVSARAFAGVVVLADAMSVSGSTDADAVGSALKSLRYSADESIFSGDGIAFDEAGGVVGPETMVLQMQSGTPRIISSGSALQTVSV